MGKDAVIQIDVYMDYVMVDNYRIDRPRRIGRDAWMAYWERRK